MTDLSELTFAEQIEYVRGAISPLDLVEQLDDIEVVSGKIRSPQNPQERTPSCHLYEDHWYDYSTGKGGDVLDLYMALTGAKLPRAVDKLLRWADSDDLDPDRVRKYQPAEPPDMTEQFRHHQRDSHGNWDLWMEKLVPINSWTINSLVESWHLAVMDGTMFIPHWHDGRVRGIKTRALDGRKAAVPGSTFACGLYWPHQVLAGDVLVIAEGESDSWCLYQALECDVAALPGGAGLWKNAWLDELDQYSTVYTAFDNDRAGQQATEKVRKAVGWDRWRELKVPTLFNDVREAMAAGWEPKL